MCIQFDFVSISSLFPAATRSLNLCMLTYIQITWIRTTKSKKREREAAIQTSESCLYTLLCFCVCIHSSSSLWIRIYAFCSVYALPTSVSYRLFECMCEPLYRHLHAHCQISWNSRELLDKTVLVPLDCRPRVCHRKFSHWFRYFIVVVVTINASIIFLFQLKLFVAINFMSYFSYCLFIFICTW